MNARVSQQIILADVGGTNARFALCNGDGAYSRLEVFRAAEEPTFVGALRRYLHRNEVGDVSGALIAAAGPIENEVVSLTNSPWRISADDVRDAVGAECAVRLFNDLEAVALALPYLGTDEQAVLGAEKRTNDQAPKLAINVGTGFGAAAAVVVDRDEWIATATEAGHMTFSARTADEYQLLERFSVVESLLSGSGVVGLYRELVEGDASSTVQTLDVTAEAVFKLAFEKAGDAKAAQAVSLFSDYLARVTGDLVVAHGAWGGVYLCGSVAKMWAGCARKADVSRFRHVFEDKGKMAARLSAVPLFVVQAEQPALMGLSHAAGRMMRSAKPAV